MSLPQKLPLKVLITRSAVAYLAWIISFLLWLWFLLLGRNALLGVLGTYFVRRSFQRNLEAQFADRAFIFIVGIAWLILMVVVEEYFRRGIKKGDLYRRIGRVFAPIIFLIFIADATMAFLTGFNSLLWSRWLLLVVELFSGIGMVWLGKNAPGPQKIRRQSQIR